MFRNAPKAGLAARTEYGGEALHLSRQGRCYAAMVSAMSTELLERLEDLLDAQAVAEVQVRLAAGTEGRRRLVSADQVSDADDVGGADSTEGG